jgi:isocitrate dehydrogenase
LNFAIKNKRKAVTIVHKGNIMKYTEGAFRKWAYEAAEEYGAVFSPSGDKGKILINDRIVDNMFMQAILRARDYDILLCPNVNGDYLADACAALIGGLGVAPGANIGDNLAIFEPVHGSAPQYAGKDLANPISFLLSGGMLFDHLGHKEAASRLRKAVEETVKAGIMTQDLAREREGIAPVKCSAFAEEVAKRIRG